MEFSRPFVKEGLIALAFFAALGATSVAIYQLTQSSRGYSTSFGGYDLRADSQRPDGTYIGVTISRSTQASQTQIFAKFARRDAKNARRWILSDGISCGYSRSGTLMSKTAFQKMTITLDKNT